MKTKSLSKLLFYDVKLSLCDVWPDFLSPPELFNQLCSDAYTEFLEILAAVPTPSHSIYNYPEYQ